MRDALGCPVAVRPGSRVMAADGSGAGASRPPQVGADAGPVTIGLSGHVPISKVAGLSSPKGCMGVGVGVVAPIGAALAVDSLHVDLTTEAVSSTEKLTVTRTRMGAIAGIGALDGVSLLDVLGDALAAGTPLERLGAAVLAGGDELLGRAYGRLLDATGRTPDEVPTEVLVVATDTAVPAILHLWTTCATGALSMTGRIYAARTARPVCVAIGVHDPIAWYTESARTDVRLSSTARTLPAADSVTALAAQASGLAARVVAREPHCARPAWWPAGVPVVAGLEPARTRPRP